MEANRKMLEEMQRSHEEKMADANAADAEEKRKAKEEEEARNSGRP